MFYCTITQLFQGMQQEDYNDTKYFVEHTLHTLVDNCDHICLFAPHTFNRVPACSGMSLRFLKWARVCNLTFQNTGSLLVSVASFVT